MTKPTLPLTFPLNKDWEVQITNSVVAYDEPAIYMVHTLCGAASLLAFLKDKHIISMRFNIKCRMCHSLFPDHRYLTPELLKFVDLYNILELNI